MGRKKEKKQRDFLRWKDTKEIYRDVGGSRDCHTEWSKSEREKQISYINTYMWNLEKWYRWTSLQGRNWDTDVENKRRDTKRGKRLGGGAVMNWEIGIDIYTLICIKWITNKNLLYKKIKFQNSKKKKCNNCNMWTLINWLKKIYALEIVGEIWMWDMNIYIISYIWWNCC